MNFALTNSTSSTLTMSSREIADLTGKDHKHVMADIRTMLEALAQTSAEFSAHLPDTYGRAQPVFNLPHRETMILLTGYSVPMRAKVVDRWKELEAQSAPAIPTSFREALLLAAAQQEQIEVMAAQAAIAAALHNIERPTNDHQLRHR